MSDFYGFSLKHYKGNEYPLSNLKGKLVLIVNTATNWGFTPQYADLGKVYEDLHDKGFEILAIPCNQFGRQAPGKDQEIFDFVTKTYNVKFMQMQKSEVNGENELPLYTYLKSEQGFKGFGEGPIADKMNGLLEKIDKDFKNNSNIKWNFTKFLIDKEGKVVARFEPTCEMAEVRKEIDKLM